MRSRIIKVSVRVISLSLWLQLIAPTLTLIILDITKTSSNNCKTVETFNFGSDFKRWIQVLYNNISSCTVNNGFSSPFFNLHRGVGQGCPLSGMLFILAYTQLLL